MAFAFSILRPDDLVALEVEARNLRLDTSIKGQPRLVVEAKNQAALLIFRFPPQSITEQAFFEIDATPPPSFNPPPDPAPQSTDDPLLAPGSVGVRMSAESRLVFRLPKGATHIDYDVASLLDWSRLELALSPVAAIAAGAAAQGSPPKIAEPAADETAIEIPYRLVLSPTALGGKARPAFRSAAEPVIHAGRAELWHTRLVRARDGKPGAAPTLTETSEHDPLPLRAVWSPDFVGGGPLPPHADDDSPFRSPMTPRDRDQIVILTSGFDGYGLSTPTGDTAYAPAPIEASALYLSALGGWLSSNGAWPDGVFYRYFPFLHPYDAAQHAAVAQPAAPPVIGPLPEAVATLDLVAWRHVATQGRDHYVRIVYDGYLYPFGHKASLVKITERVVKGPEGGQVSPVAYLRQRMFVVVKELEKDYAGAAFAHAGRELPLTLVRIDTKATPDIDPPTFIGGGASFWIDVGAGHFPFKLTATDIAGAQIDFHTPLIFVSLSETNLGLATAEYARDDQQRRSDVKGRNVAYADPDAGDTTFKTTALYFDSQVLNASPPWPTAPFLPVLDHASVTVPAIAQLLGRQVAVMIGWYQPYLVSGLDAKAGVFADIISNPPDVGFAADKAGGLATPNLTLSALSARKGLVSGSADHAAGGVIDPSEYFGPVDAKLFGTVPLAGLIPIDPATLVANADNNAPEIRGHLIPNRQNPVQAITNIIWKPDLKPYEKDPVKVEFNQDAKPSELSLTVKIVRQFDGTPPTTTAEGKLTNFRLSLLGVIALRITQIKFTSQNHQKTIVVADLAATQAIVFEGPLSFIQTLSNILPPGLFGGSGPTIQTTPTALQVTYTLGLPPVTCGVFSLQNIAIMVGLDLPYLDGKPEFEFGFASRGKPFLVTIEIFGGGGFVHLIVDADGVQMVEAAIEFGGNFAFDIGIASGGVHAMAGIYFQLKAATQPNQGPTTDLTGFVDIGGEVSVLGIISISLDLNISLSWISSPSGNLIDGKATMSISVHIIFFSVSVSVSVERSFKAGGGDPQVCQLMNDNDWADYAEAFA